MHYHIHMVVRTHIMHSLALTLTLTMKTNCLTLIFYITLILTWTLKPSSNLKQHFDVERTGQDILIMPKMSSQQLENLHNYKLHKDMYTHAHTHFLHSNWDSLVQSISANNSWVICAPCRPLAFLFNLLSPTVCLLINNTHQHVC